MRWQTGVAAFTSVVFESEHLDVFPQIMSADAGSFDWAKSVNDSSAMLTKDRMYFFIARSARNGDI